MYFLRKKFAIPFILFMILMGFLWNGLKSHPNLIPSPLINQPAPEFSLPQLFNPKKMVSNNDFIGHVTLLNVWASWCYACAEEHDFLLTLSKHKDFIIVGLNYKDDISQAKQWLKEHGNPYQIVAVDASGRTSIDWGVYGVPETFIIDKKGVIRYKHVGAINETAWERTLYPMIMRLRNEIR